MKAIESLGEFEQLILLAILRLTDQAYGVSIRREILKCTGREVSPGAVYTALDRLEKKGMVDAQDGEARPERGGRTRRLYTVTDKGLRSVRQAQVAFKSMLYGLRLLEESHG